MELARSNVVFDQENHTYFLGEKQLSGITFLLDRQFFGDKYTGIPEFVLEKARVKGTLVHEACELIDTLGVEHDSAEAWNYIRLKNENDLRHEASEYLVSDEKNVASCIDKVFRVSETEFALADIKTTIRQVGIRNIIIIIMNPCDSTHWVYRKFIENTHKLVDYDGIPVQISTAQNVLHIHTTYLDNKEHLSKQFLEEVEKMKKENPEKYAHIVIGRWADVAEGAIFKKWGIVDEFPIECKKVGIGLDFGFTHDPTAAIRCGIVDNRLYLDEVDYRTNLLSSDIIKTLRPWGMKVIADSADPRTIQEIHNGGIRIYAVEKGAGSIVAGIDKMKEYEIFVTKRSYNLQNERRNYVWAKDKDGNYINEPEDHDNHGIDAARYWVLGELLGKIQKPKNIDGIFTH